jgi:hypothetical protein
MDSSNDGVVSVGITDPWIDANLPIHAMRTGDRWEINGGFMGSTGGTAGTEYGCLYADDYLATGANFGRLRVYGTQFGYCRWIHLGSFTTNTQAMIHGYWFFPSSSDDAALPGGGYIESGYAVMDLGLNVISLNALAQPLAPMLYGLPDIFPAGAPVVDADMHLTGYVHDEGCLFAGLSADADQTLIDAAANAGDPAAGGVETIDFQYTQGPDCQDEGELNFLSAAVEADIAAGAEVHMTSRGQELHCRGNVACLRANQSLRGAGCGTVLWSSSAPNVAQGTDSYQSLLDNAGSDVEANEDDFVVPGPVEISNLDCEVDAPPGAGDLWDITVRTGAPGALANTAVTCQIAGAETSCTPADLTNMGTAVARDAITLGISGAGGATNPAAATMTCRVCLGK